MEDFFNSTFWTVLAGVLAVPIAWYFGGKSKSVAEAKKIDSEANKIDSETKKNNSDAVGTMQTVYNDFLMHYQKTMEQVIDELQIVKNHNTSLQIQLDKLESVYQKEVVTNANWEKLHNEMSERYMDLNKEHEILKALYSALKKDLDNYKKSQNGQ